MVATSMTNFPLLFLLITGALELGLSTAQPQLPMHSSYRMRQTETVVNPEGKESMHNSDTPLPSSNHFRLGSGAWLNGDPRGLTFNNASSSVVSIYGNGSQSTSSLLHSQPNRDLQPESAQHPVDGKGPEYAIAGNAANAYDSRRGSEPLGGGRSYSFGSGSQRAKAERDAVGLPRHSSPPPVVIFSGRRFLSDHPLSMPWLSQTAAHAAETHVAMENKLREDPDAQGEAIIFAPVMGKSGGILHHFMTLSAMHVSHVTLLIFALLMIAWLSLVVHRNGTNGDEEDNAPEGYAPVAQNAPPVEQNPYFRAFNPESEEVYPFWQFYSDIWRWYNVNASLSDTVRLSDTERAIAVAASLVGEARTVVDALPSRWTEGQMDQ